MTTPASDPILSLTDTRLTLDGNAGPVDILRGITLSVNRGETLGLIGPSGSGKSSLLMLMGGLERATGGTIRALGQDLTAMDEGNLDGPNGQAIMDLLFGLRDRHGATLVLVTHAPELANRCDRVIRLRDGLLDRAEAAA